ncbi:hypothetical protein [Nocardia nepalensis]|uniref:hypothetical protein n=1 Tax=Nocardia nepalensis TaxID=3375448 RepID=UPI003B670234
MKGRSTVPSDHQPPDHFVFGLSPNRSALFSAPPVEARPDQPLPDAGPFLRVFTSEDEPGTVLMRCARQYIGIWRYIYEHGRNTGAPAEEHLSLLTWLIDREAGGHISGIAVDANAPTNPSSYGEMVAWLGGKYLLVALRQDQSAHAEHDAAELNRQIEALDQLVADVRAGRVRLPETAREGFPPRTIRPEGSATEDVDAPLANRSPDEAEC